MDTRRMAALRRTAMRAILAGIIGMATLAHPGIARSSPTVLFQDGFDAENAGHGQLNYVAWTNWNVIAGCVDLMGNGFFYDYGSHGLVAELDGSCWGTTPTSTFRTRSSFTLEPGTRYELRFDMAGNGNSHPPDPVVVSMGSTFQETFAIETGWPNAFTTIVRTFEPAVATSAPLVFHVPNTSDFQGHFIDNVTLSATPVDATAPVVTGAPDRLPNGAGWYSGPVTIHWLSTDPDPSSGTPTQPTPLIAAIEGKDVVYTSEPSCDPAGNCATGSVALSIDLSDPTVSCTSAPTFLLNEPGAAVSGTVADAISGPVATSIAVPADTSNPGTFVAEVTGTDLAGRSDTVACPYRVAYGFSGFLAPVEDPPAVNQARAGRTIPVAWRLTDAGGAPIADASSFVGLTATAATCGAGTGPGGTTEISSGRSGLQYLGDGAWQFNWKTQKAYAGSCRVLSLNLADGTSRTALFQFA
jgi:hypothetical protein